MAMKQHMILGKNRRDVEARRDEWISENPEITVVRVHRPKREPDSWLTLLGGRDVPRVSIIVEYEVNALENRPTNQQVTPTDTTATSDDDKTSTLSPT
jgi:hypothetical protein